MRAIIVFGVAAFLCSAGRIGNSADGPADQTPRASKARPSAPKAGKELAMSANKRTVQKYMEAFGKSNHEEVLSCLADDVEWVIPGMFHVRGKAAFDKQIENDAFVGSPTITISRMVEENDVVVCEGSVRSARKDGGVLNAVFCDVFVLKDAKIRHLTSYLIEVK
jgi:ketosteroid isomerase-like protein